MSVGSGYITISRSSGATNFPVWPSIVQLARSSVRIRHSTFTFSDGFAKYRGYLHGIDTFDGCRVRRSEGGGVKRAISTAEFRAWTAAQQNYYFIRGTLLISSVVAIVVSPSWLLSGRVYGSPASNPGVAASHTRWRARTYVLPQIRAHVNIRMHGETYTCMERGEKVEARAAAPAVHILARSTHTTPWNSVARAHTPHSYVIYVWLYVAVEWSCGGRVGGRVGGRTIVYSADYWRVVCSGPTCRTAHSK